MTLKNLMLKDMEDEGDSDADNSFQQESQLTPSSHLICFQHVHLDANAIQELYTVPI